MQIRVRIVGGDYSWPRCRCLCAGDQHLLVGSLTRRMLPLFQKSKRVQVNGIFGFTTAAYVVAPFALHPQPWRAAGQEKRTSVPYRYGIVRMALAPWLRH